MRGTCAVIGCDHLIQGRSWCSTHYSRWWQFGNPMGFRTLESQLLARVVVDDNGCWLWQSFISKPSGISAGGYGVHGRDYAHRISYEVFVGAIPLGTEIDHLCRVRRCIRPSHLEPVTRRENLMRGRTFAARHAAKTHCPQGHPYDEENTKWTGKNLSQRQCRACARSRQRAYKARKEGAR